MSFCPRSWERPLQDAAALRLLGAVHRIVLDGRAPELARFYPSAGGDDDGDAWPAFLGVLEAHRAEIEQGLREQVQTNEIGRAAVLAGGFTEIARRTGLPLALFEVGCSAGLNLRWDRYAFDTGLTVAGDPASALRFAGVWEGRAARSRPPRSGRRATRLRHLADRPELTGRRPAARVVHLARPRRATGPAARRDRDRQRDTRGDRARPTPVPGSPISSPALGRAWRRSCTTPSSFNTFLDRAATRCATRCTPRVRTPPPTRPSRGFGWSRRERWPIYDFSYGPEVAKRCSPTSAITAGRSAGGRDR